MSQLRNGQHRFDEALDESLPTASVASAAPPAVQTAKREQRQLQPSDVKLPGMKLFCAGAPGKLAAPNQFVDLGLLVMVTSMGSRSD